MRTTATATESCSTVEPKSTISAPGDGSPWPSTISKIAGIVSAAAARKSMEACTLEAVRLKCWVSNRNPPTNIDAPSTSSTLPMIEPTIEALTTSCRPSPSANSAMISSGALPKVTLRNPADSGPRPGGQLLGRPSHECRRRDDAQRRGEEHPRGPGVGDPRNHPNGDQRHPQVRQ